MRHQSRTPWKKSRTYGDIHGGRLRRRMTDNIFARRHSLKPPSPGQALPIFVEDNPSKEYYFPISKADLEEVLAKLPKEEVEGLTHIWLRRNATNTADKKGWFAEFICGSKVRVIIIYPWPVDGKRLLGRAKPSLRQIKEYQRFNAKLIKEKGKWYVYLDGENLKKFYIECLFLHEVGHHIDWYYRHWSKANRRKREEYADQYALKTAHVMSNTEPDKNQTFNINPPIGVFDSGIGGLSILKDLMRTMPGQRFVYMADTAYAPYGEQSNDYILERSHHIARWMHDEQGVCGLVIACNTATAVAAKSLRETFGSGWPIVGVEPGLKPAAQISQTGRIGIMATAATLKSDKFQTLMRRVHDNESIPLQLSLCACNGLARAIEFNLEDELSSLIEKYTQELKQAHVDVVVLGCTHYSLVKDRIMQALPGITVLDTGEAVARQTVRMFQGVLGATDNVALGQEMIPCNEILQAWSNTPLLQSSLKRCLPEVRVKVQEMDI